MLLKLFAMGGVFILIVIVGNYLFNGKKYSAITSHSNGAGVSESPSLQQHHNDSALSIVDRDVHDPNTGSLNP